MTVGVRSVAILALLFVGDVKAQEPPVLIGLDHIPLVVADLDQAKRDFEELGFSIKSGRFHADGIKKVHLKFPDGTELELITAAKGVDELTREYRRKLASSEGPVYFGLYAPDQPKLFQYIHTLGFPLQQDGGGWLFSRPHHHCTRYSSD